MTYLLLVSDNFAKNCLYYGACIAIIIAALIIMGAMKSKTKKEMRPASVKKACVKAKVCAEKILAEKSVKMLAGTKLLRLNKYVANAFWLAFQIAENRKDIVFEGIAGTLDGLSSTLVKESNNGYLSQEEFETCVRGAIETLNVVIEKIAALEN
ncbi:MAG: hypothetical protein IJX30_05120 [Clostridia bacterium]|nr:hypothetical protein [Clostridia bacterium]